MVKMHVIPERWVVERWDKVEVKVVDKSYPTPLVSSFYPFPFLRSQSGVGFNGEYLLSLRTV